MKSKKSLINAIIFRTLAILLLIAPMIVLTVCRKDVWFVKEQNVNKMSIGFIIALIFSLLMLKGAFKNLDKRVVPMIVMATFAVITWLLDSIINDIFWVLLCSLIGYILYIAVDSVGTHYMRIYKEYSGEKIRAIARRDYEQEEINNSGRG